MNEIVSWDIEEMANSVADAMGDLGWNRDEIKAFFCLRFHITHPWGLACVLINGEKRIAVVRPGDCNDTMEVMFVSRVEGLDIKDRFGNSMNEKGQLPFIELPSAKEIN